MFTNHFMKKKMLPKQKMLKSRYLKKISEPLIRYQSSNEFHDFVNF